MFDRSCGKEKHKNNPVSPVNSVQNKIKSIQNTLRVLRVFAVQFFFGVINE
jgi:hypothetical protein